jgi:hypothetical protein
VDAIGVRHIIYQVQYERVAAAAQRILGDEVLAAALEAGRSVPEVEAIVEALALADELTDRPL